MGVGRDFEGNTWYALMPYAELGHPKMYDDVRLVSLTVVLIDGFDKPKFEKCLGKFVWAYGTVRVEGFHVFLDIGPMDPVSRFDEEAKHSCL